MESKPKTAPVSSLRLVIQLGLNAWILSSIGIFIALAFIQSTLRLSPAQLVEALVGLVWMWPPFMFFNLLGGYITYQPIRTFLRNLEQKQTPSPSEATAIQHCIFRFAFSTSVLSATLWCLGAIAAAAWTIFRSDLAWMEGMGIVISGAFVGTLTSIFSFFLVRRTMRPVQALLHDFLPKDDPNLLVKPLTLRKKMAFSFTYLIVSILICMVYELYSFQRFTLLDQGLAEARNLVAQAKQSAPSGQPLLLPTFTGFGYRVRLFAQDAAGRLQAGELEPAETAQLLESRYLLGRKAYDEAHPFWTRIAGWVAKLFLEPDHHLTRLEGRTLAYLLPTPSADDTRVGAVLEILPQPGTRKQYSSVSLFLLNHPTPLLVLFVFSCLGFTLILTYLIIGDVAGPLRRLQATARSIQEGDLSARTRFDTDDEIGLLILDFNRMADRLAEKVKESERLVTALREATQSLGAASGKIVDIATDQATGATEQAASIQQVSTTSEEVAATLKMISENARSVERVAGQTLEACRRGREDIGAIIGGMDRINSRVREIATEMLRLQEHALKIESILDLIREVSEKTNMISLNASIEAAAAGEAGRRFNIIAGEVRELAEQITGSIREINDMIALLQQATNRAIMVTEEGTKQVDATHTMVAQVGHSFQNLNALAEETSTAAKEISLSSSQQTSAGEHLATTIAEINEVAHNFVQSAREIESSTLELNRLAEHLRQMMSSNGDQNRTEPDFVPTLSSPQASARKEEPR